MPRKSKKYRSAKQVQQRKNLAEARTGQHTKRPAEAKVLAPVDWRSLPRKRWDRMVIDLSEETVIEADLRSLAAAPRKRKCTGKAFASLRIELIIC